MKNCILILLLAFISVCVKAQSVEGRLTLNGKSELSISPETNSVVQLFKEFKEGKYQLQFDFEGDNLVKNLYKEEVVFFEFTTVIKKDGKTLKKITRTQPMPFFPGEMVIPAETFDFIGMLAFEGAKEEKSAVIPNEMTGTLGEGKYTVELYASPKGVEGKVRPVAFEMVLRKRPGRAK